MKRRGSMIPWKRSYRLGGDKLRKRRLFIPGYPAERKKEKIIIDNDPSQQQGGIERCNENARDRRGEEGQSY